MASRPHLQCLVVMVACAVDSHLRRKLSSEPTVVVSRHKHSEQVQHQCLDSQGYLGFAQVATRWVGYDNYAKLAGVVIRLVGLVVLDEQSVADVAGRTGSARRQNEDTRSGVVGSRTG